MGSRGAATMCSMLKVGCSQLPRNSCSVGTISSSVVSHCDVQVSHHLALPREAAHLSQHGPSDALYLPGAGFFSFTHTT